MDSKMLTLDQRVEMTISCSDCDDIPKVRGAGKIRRNNGVRIQKMHNGVKVLAGGYYGDWMEEIIKKLKGHHEPQEEKVFYEILQRLTSNPTMIEMGAFWGYYSLWLKNLKPDANCFLIEPDKNNIKIGKKNFKLNSAKAKFINASVGAKYKEKTNFIQESDSKKISIPQVSTESIFKQYHLETIDLLHCDAQGQELEVLKGTKSLIVQNKIRFIIISTHHHSISNDPLTHQKCLSFIRKNGGHIIAEHSVFESFSGDGLIAASFFPEDKDFSISISHNRASKSLFREIEYELAEELNKKKELVSKISSFALSDDITFYFNSDDSFVGIPVSQGIYEPFETQLMIDSVNIGDIVLDVGANIGYHTIQLAKKVGPTGQVIAFEPDPKNYELLQLNIKKNNLENVTALNYAVGESVEDMKLYISEENPGDHRVFPDQTEDRESITIKVTTIDEIWKSVLKKKNIDFVKCDTQGYEPFVIQGMREMIDTCRPAIFFEFWKYGYDCAKANSSKMWKILDNYYQFHVINEIEKNISSIDYEGCLKRCEGNDAFDHCNIIAARTGLIDKIHMRSTLDNINQKVIELEKTTDKLTSDLSKIQSSKTYRLWQKYVKIKQQLTR